MYAVDRYQPPQFPQFPQSSQFAQQKQHQRHLKDMRLRMKKMKVLAGIWQDNNRIQSDLSLFRLKTEREQRGRDFWIKFILLMLPSVVSCSLAFHVSQQDINLTSAAHESPSEALNEATRQINKIIEKVNSWFLFGSIIGLLFRICAVVFTIILNVLVQVGISSIIYFKGFLTLAIALTGPVVSLIFFIFLQLFSNAKVSTPFVSIETHSNYS